MVTNIKQSTAKSNAEETLKNLSAKTKDLVTGAIKSRKESFTELCNAAAHSVYLGIVHGRWEQFNRLFVELPTIDSDALRQKFALRVNDKYAADGLANPEYNPESPNGEKEWLKRPTQMISYKAQPETKGEHFTLAKADASTERGKEKAVLISAFVENVKKAGIEDIASIIWETRGAVVAKDDAYTIQNAQKQAMRLCENMIYAMKKPDSGISKSNVLAVARAVNMVGPELAKLEGMMFTLDIKTATKPESELIKTEKPEGENQSDETPKEIAA